jgi:tRNA A-37 threonylcarbamoyl transferase component Bud32
LNKKMDYAKLNSFTYSELKGIAEDMDIPIKRNKSLMITDIKEGLLEYEQYKKKKIDRYIRISQLGTKGKEGITYLVKSTKDGKEYAMKTFRKGKSSTTLRKEAFLQKMASDEGAAPAVIDVDTVSKYIVQEKMDKHLIDVMKANGGDLKEHHQRQMIKLFRKLDKARVFHGDSNIMNFMFRGSKLYLIDYGMSNEINSGLIKKLGTDQPNMELMLLGQVLKLKELRCPESSYNILREHLTQEQRTQFRL